MRLRPFATTAAMALALTGCSSSGDDGSSDPDPAPTTGSPTSVATSESASASASASSDPAPRETPAAPDANCLFSVAEISDVLGGTWKRRASTQEPCAYGSDRGAVVATTRVDDDVDDGLADAREACLPSIKPIRLGKQTFVCVEDHEPSDSVVGNTVARGELWIAVISVADDSVPAPELAAMVALMGAV